MPSALTTSVCRLTALCMFVWHRLHRAAYGCASWVDTAGVRTEDSAHASLESVRDRELSGDQSRSPRRHPECCIYAMRSRDRTCLRYPLKMQSLTIDQPAAMDIRKPHKEHKAERPRRDGNQRTQALEYKKALKDYDVHSAMLGILVSQPSSSS